MSAARKPSGVVVVGTKALPKRPAAARRIDVAAKTKGGPLRLVAWVFAACAALTVIGMAAMGTGSDSEPTASAGSSGEVAAFVAQMRAAAKDGSATLNLFGGTLTPGKGQDKTAVEARGVPQKACVGAGWTLAREGVVEINGVLSQRLSASRLAAMCSQASAEGSTILWRPKQ